MIISISAAPVVDTKQICSVLSAKHRLPILGDPMKVACDAHRFQTVYDMPQELQAQVRRNVLKEHKAFLLTRSPAVLDFSAVVWCADWMRWGWGSTPTAEWDRVMAVLAECVGLYDRIVHLDEGSLKPYDGYIWRDAANARQVNSLVHFLYRELGVDARVEYLSADGEPA